MDALPQAVTRDQSFLAAICMRLEAQNTLLADIRDRLPVPMQVAQPEPGAGPQAVQLREPASVDGVAADSAVEGGAGLLMEPAPPHPPAKAARTTKTTTKTTARKTARSKES